jgi:hypothetical protein
LDHYLDDFIFAGESNTDNSLYNDKVVDAFAVAMYNVLLNVLPAGRALEQNARIPHKD